MECINNKTFCAYDENNDTFKMAIKGSNRNIISPLEQNKNVLRMKNIMKVSIEVFCLVNKQYKTNDQIKNSLLDSITSLVF